jgi:hypothetical protein
MSTSPGFLAHGKQLYGQLPFADRLFLATETSIGNAESTPIPRIIGMLPNPGLHITTRRVIIGLLELPVPHKTVSLGI